MPKIAVLFGLILIVIGAAGYFTAGSGGEEKPEADVATSGDSETGTESADQSEAEQAESKPGKRSWTALIPAFFGIVIAVCGLIGMTPERTKHAMHAAAGIAFLGALMSTGRGIPSIIKVFNGDEGANSKAAVLILLMAATCWGFTFLAFQSFLKARAASSAKAD